MPEISSLESGNLSISQIYEMLRDKNGTVHIVADHLNFLGDGQMSNATNTESEMPLAYRVKAFCRRVGISPATFYKYVGLGKIRVIKIGGRTLVPAAEVDRILRGEA